MDQLSTDTFASKRLALTMGGVAENIALPAQRHVSFALTGAATGITAVRADVAKALGEQINLDIAGDWKAGAAIHLAKAQLSGNDLSILLAGDVADYAFNGGIKVKAASVAPFSELAGRQLSGALDMDAAGSIEPISGAFDLSIDSVASGLGIGSEPVDNLLAGDTRITGSLARGETGIVARQLRVFNSQASATANGTFASGAADFDFDFELNDLALLSDRAAGKLTAKGRAKGSDGLIGLTFSANVPSGSLVDKPLADAVLGFEGTLRDGEVDGQIDGQALLGGVPIRLSSAIALLEKERRLGALNFTAGEATIIGRPGAVRCHRALSRTAQACRARCLDSGCPCPDARKRIARCGCGAEGRGLTAGCDDIGQCQEPGRRYDEDRPGTDRGKCGGPSQGADDRRHRPCQRRRRRGHRDRPAERDRHAEAKRDEFLG